MHDGVPLRCVARVTGASDGFDNSGIFIAGNALELVPAGHTEGERFTFSAIFDAHASDKDLCEAEVLPLLASLVEGSNVHVVVLGHHRSGHVQLVNTLAPLLVDVIFNQLHQRQAVLGGKGVRLAHKLSAKVACAVIGQPDRMSDLLAAGSTELRIVRDAEAVGGVVLPGLHAQPIAQSADFIKAFKSARSRLAQQHKPPAPSSVLWLQLEQILTHPGGRTEEIVSQVVVTGVEVGNLGDGIASALRTVLSTPPTRAPPASGAALLLGDAIGGNSRGLLIGCARPTDAEE